MSLARVIGYLLAAVWPSAGRWWFQRLDTPEPVSESVKRPRGLR